VKFLVFVLIVTTDVKKKNFSHSFCGHPAACGSSHKMMLQKSQKETGKGGGGGLPQMWFSCVFNQTRISKDFACWTSLVIVLRSSDLKFEMG